jgi:hypothetical protein
MSLSTILPRGNLPEVPLNFPFRIRITASTRLETPIQNSAKLVIRKSGLKIDGNEVVWSEIENVTFRASSVRLTLTDGELEFKTLSPLTGIPDRALGSLLGVSIRAMKSGNGDARRVAALSLRRLRILSLWPSCYRAGCLPRIRYSPFVPNAVRNFGCRSAKRRANYFGLDAELLCPIRKQEDLSNRKSR